MSNIVNDEIPSETRIGYTRTAREYYVYPTRRSIRIDEGDWERWIRTINNIPKREALFRDIAFTSLGISIPSFISGFTSASPTSPLPNWHFVVAIVTLVVAIICFLFDLKIEKMASSTVIGILQDMNEVRQRSVYSEETTLSKGQGVQVDQQRNIGKGELVIDSAEYGTQDKKADVTQILRSKILEGKLEIEASNTVLVRGDDPASGKPKELRVVYFYAGKKYSRSVPEDEILYLP